jgi:hypothetical protein
MYQYNDRLTQLFTRYKYIWLWLQCFDPYLGSTSSTHNRIDPNDSRLRMQRAKCLLPHSTDGRLVLVMVLNSTVLFISISTFVSNHILQIVVWTQGNKSFMWPSRDNMGSDWALQSHYNWLMCEKEHFHPRATHVPKVDIINIHFNYHHWVLPGSLL